MKQALKRVWIRANVLRSAPALLAYASSPARAVIDADVARWARVILDGPADGTSWHTLHHLLLSFPEFRNLFYHRIAGFSPVIARLIEPFYPRLKSLFLSTDRIGPGLIIYHGFSTIVHARSIGSNCNIAQQVTIGRTDRGYPTIGDDVQITAGAVVIGEITIGDNSIVGANATVTKDVPSDCVVVGNPAFIVRRNGVKVREGL